MAEAFNPITVALIPDDDSPLSPALAQRCLFLATACRFNYGRVIGSLRQGDRKGETLGRLWSDVLPTGGKYTFDLATSLPYYLPQLDGETDFALSVGSHEVVVSNRMIRCFEGEGPKEARGLDYFLVHRHYLEQVVDSRRGSMVHPLPLKTLIARRFQCEASDAESAISANFSDWQQELVEDIAKIVDAFRSSGLPDSKRFLPHGSVASFPLFWLMVQGLSASGELRIAGEQFVGDLGQAAFRSIGNVTAERARQVCEVLQTGRKIPPHESALSLASTFLHYGYLSLAVVQVCIGAELVLAETYQAYLRSRGASKKKIAEFAKEITFSQLLNVHVYAMVDLGRLPGHQDTIGQINWARRQRNELVHEGTSSSGLQAHSVKEAISAARRLTDFLLAESAAFGGPSEAH